MAEREIIIISAGKRGRDGTYAGETDVASLRTRVGVLEGQPVISELDAIPDVNAVSPADGDALVYDAGAGEWVNATQTSGLALVRQEHGAMVEVPNATTLTLGEGLSVNDTWEDEGRAHIVPVFGGTGTSTEISRRDHTHNIYAPTRATFGPQAYMSSGTRSLTSTNVTLPAGISCVVKARLNMQMRGADPGACYYQLRVTIDGAPRTSGGGTAGFWCVQGVPDKTTWEHHAVITGAGTAVTVSADVIYHSGGGFYTDAGELVIEIDAAR